MVEVVEPPRDVEPEKVEAVPSRAEAIRAIISAS
jgi:hypothetical protein